MSSTFWSVICLVGVWGFVFCTVFFILKSFPSRGEFHRGHALRWGAAMLACFVAWVLGMTQA